MERTILQNESSNADLQPTTGTVKKKISLALQGGGSHGAFTWGVLDRLLADGRLEIEGISGTSAGAMNATLLAYGLALGGADEARAKLNQFWQEIIELGKFSFLKPSLLDKMLSRGNMDFSPSFLFFDYLAKLFSPYELNPLNINPLRDILAKLVDFDVLHAKEVCKLFIAATNVNTGRLHIFKNTEVSLLSVMASACLPFLFQAVNINGEHYWDGGYIGNPPLFPLINETKSQDILIVQINPVNTSILPTSAREVFDRINTISFNSSLIRELRAVHFVTNLIDGGELNSNKYKRVFIHTIDAESIVQNLGVSSKLNTDSEFIHYLYTSGQQLADDFLNQHFDKIGKESSTDIATEFI